MDSGHGDFHPDNVLITARGPVIIDWNDATLGVPAADVARSTLLLRDSALPHDAPTPRLLRRIRGLFYRSYRQQYRKLRGSVVFESAEWEPLIAGARLAEGIIEENEHLLHLAGTVPWGSRK